MKKFTKWEEGPVWVRSVGPLPGIELLNRDGGDSDQVLAIAKEPDGQIRFVEMQDEWNSTTMSKDDAITALREAIIWIMES